MRYVESLVEYKVYTYGWLQRPNGTWVCLPRDDFQAKQIMVWADLVSKSMRKATLHGIMMSKSLRTFKPPHKHDGNADCMAPRWQQLRRARAQERQPPEGQEVQRLCQGRDLHSLLFLLQRSRRRTSPSIKT